MHLASGDRQMNTEMNCSRKLKLVICIGIYMFLNGICCGQYQRVVILNGSESNLP